VGNLKPSLAIHFIEGTRVFVHGPQDKHFCVCFANKNKVRGWMVRCSWLNTTALSYLSRGLSTKIVVAKPLIAIDNSFRSWDNFDGL